jgi:hypothetical protein
MLHVKDDVDFILQKEDPYLIAARKEIDALPTTPEGLAAYLADPLIHMSPALRSTMEGIMQEYQRRQMEYTLSDIQNLFTSQNSQNPQEVVVVDKKEIKEIKKEKREPLSKEDQMDPTHISYILMGFHGRMGSGKDTCATLCEGQLKGHYSLSLYAPFAEALREVLFLLSNQNPGLAPENTMAQSDKLRSIERKVFNPIHFEHAFAATETFFGPQNEKEQSETTRLPFLQVCEKAKECFLKWWPEDSKETKTVRELLQFIGTDIGRNIYHPEIWVKLWQQHLLEALSKFGQRYKKPSLILVPDVRFENEFKMIIGMKGHVIHILRPSLDTDNKKANQDHASEKPIQGCEFTHVVENSGTLLELKAKMETICTIYKKT